MRVTLIYPAIGRRADDFHLRSWEVQPLFAAVLKKTTPADVEVRLYDDRIERIPFDEPTDIVGISVMTHTAKRAYQIATEYRRRGVPVVLGGIHVTLTPEEASRFAEAIVIGDGERAWPALLADFARGRLQPRYEMPLEDLTGIGVDRSVFEGKRYFPLAMIENGRGCTRKCDFCSVTKAFGGKRRTRPTSEVIAEIKESGSRAFVFVDDNVLGDGAMTDELLGAMADLRIMWFGQANVDVGFDEPMLKKLAKSGCRALLLGLESLNEDNLRQMKKGVNLHFNDYGKAIANMRRHGIAVYPNFIFGYDHDTEQTLQDLYRFALENRTFMLAVNHLTPFPGTGLYEKLAADERLRFDRWWLDDEATYTGVHFEPAGSMTRAEVEDGCNDLRRRLYTMRSILTRGLDFRANCASPARAYIYWAANRSLAEELTHREALHFGDESFEGELQQS